jgi:hypothetical protein
MHHILNVIGCYTELTNEIWAGNLAAERKPRMLKM